MTALKSIINKIFRPPRYHRYGRGLGLIELSIGLLLVTSVGIAGLSLSLSMQRASKASEASKRVLFIMQSVRNGMRNNRFDRPTTDDVSLVDDIKDSQIWPESFFMDDGGSTFLRSPYGTKIDVKTTDTDTPDVFSIVIHDIPQQGCFAVGMGLLSARDSLKFFKISSTGTEYEADTLSNLDTGDVNSSCTSTASSNDIQVKFR